MHFIFIIWGGGYVRKSCFFRFPPKTMFRFDFTKTAKENYLHEFYWPAYTDQMGSKQETLTNGVYAYVELQDQ